MRRRLEGVRLAGDIGLDPGVQGRADARLLGAAPAGKPPIRGVVSRIDEWRTFLSD
jgi:hypothetical protein